MRHCQAVTKKNKQCRWPVEEWRKHELCHIHDPEGTFRQQQLKKGRGAKPKMPKLVKLEEDMFAEMFSMKCTANPFIKGCIFPGKIHCDTIDYMIEIVQDYMDKGVKIGVKV